MSSAFAEDFSLEKRWGISGGAGWPVTFNNNRFDKRADGDFSFNLGLRYNFSNYDSLTVGYSRYEFDHTPTCPRVYDALYLSRINGAEKFTPVLGLGLGVADIPNYNIDENLKAASRARIGLEYAFSKNLYSSLSLDYVYISKMIGEKRTLVIGEIHVFVPQFGFQYYF